MICTRVSQWSKELVNFFNNKKINASQSKIDVVHGRYVEIRTKIELFNFYQDYSC